MDTLTKLQHHLAGPVIVTRSGYVYKHPVKHIRCKDGTSVSIQASELHYCQPKNNFGPYTKVEVWCVEGNTKPITEFEYDEEHPSEYIPIEQVVLFIDNRGGMV